jgi:hypothetical protein
MWSIICDVREKEFRTPRGRVAVLLGIALISLTLACSLGDLVQVSFGNPTPTRTRTPRPTFTPRVEPTSTPEDTLTPTATDTLASTATATRRPVTVVVRTPTKPPPPQPTPLPVTLVLSYPCTDAGPGVWEVIGSIRKPGSVWLANYVLAIMTPAGRILKTQTSVSDDEKINALDISCQRSGVLPYNVKISADELRTAGPLVVRIIKSTGDATPLSPSVNVDFTSPIRWFVFYDVP